MFLMLSWKEHLHRRTIDVTGTLPFSNMLGIMWFPLLKVSWHSHIAFRKENENWWSNWQSSYDLFHPSSLISIFFYCISAVLQALGFGSYSYPPLDSAIPAHSHLSGMYPAIVFAKCNMHTMDFYNYSHCAATLPL